MKTNLLFCFLVMLSATPIFCNAQHGAVPGTATNSLDTNNISFYIQNDGAWGADLLGIPKCRMPKSSKNSTIFAGSLWLGGMAHGKLHIAAMTYRQKGWDFFTGPLDTSTATTDSQECRNYDHLWKLKRKDINNFRNGSAAPIHDMNTWPGNPMVDVAGNVNPSYTSRAPYADLNGNGIYDINAGDPKNSDYPLMSGDEQLWWMVNDMGNIHGETGGLPLGVEVMSRAFSYACSSDTALNNTVFFQYQITNRSTNTYDSFYVGSWTDFDIGYGFDDYIGCDTVLNAYYGYNGEKNDVRYGSNPPAQAAVFLDAKMGNFMPYTNDFSGMGNPDSAIQYYRYMTGSWADGQYLKNDGKNGRNTGPRTHFAYPGNPADSTGWTEAGAGNPPGDRRGIASSGPYTLMAGETKTITLAYIFSQRPGAGYLGNVSAMKRDIADIRNIYSGVTTSTCANFSLAIANADKHETEFTIYPNPADRTLRIRVNTSGKYNIQLLNALGQEVYNDNKHILYEDAINLPVLPSGIYTLLLKSSTSLSAKKIVIR